MQTSDSASTATAAPRAAAQAASVPRRSPSGTAAIDWSAIEPRSLYARRVRWVLNAVLATAMLPAAVAVGLPIAVVNLCLFRDVRKILYVQPRTGRRAITFSIYKFRTMKEFTGGVEHWRPGQDRERVTRFGRFLRNTHLDELPQLINIVRRDMDVIGPRPEMVEIEQWAALHVPRFSERLAIRPGITGIAQVTQGYTGPDVDDYARKLAINLAYIRTMSLRLDCEIVLRTVVWMLLGKGSRWSGAEIRTERTPDRDETPTPH